MPLKINIGDVEPRRLEGRDLSWIVTEETIGAKQMSIAVMHCHPNAIVKPLHSHKDIEEVIYILEGQGQSWIDGELVDFKKGDAVFFPANSKHQVRNTSGETLVTLSIFARPTSPDQYVIYPESMF
ncbi:MAG: cupin domain-containing protein [Oscillospiraceae bacterium]|nr:cupin domain-containing protein [Oscillospiraceae bacterium]